MRILLMTYSVRPRGGVVHTLELASALQSVGHDVTIAAMARPGEQVFRPSDVPVFRIEHVPTEPSFDDRIAGMQVAYRIGLRELIGEGEFEILHAQDCLSANAALDLRSDGWIAHLVRTVHHVDDFTSPSLIACQERSIVEPDLLLCVSPPWAAQLWEEFAVEAHVVGNGVNTERYRPPRDAAERAEERRGLGWSNRLVILTVGGVEPRKGSMTLLDAFARVRRKLAFRRPLLVIAGGATLFDYRSERERFATRVIELGCQDDVRVTGTVPDTQLAAFYRAADVFAFPSLKEGFGLAALEAQASGLPVVASDLDVFDAFLEHAQSAVLCPAGDALALAGAVQQVAEDNALAGRLASAGPVAAARHGWLASARAHEDHYRRFLAGYRDPLTI
jgi:glycosyltransferase-like protein